MSGLFKRHFCSLLKIIIIWNHCYLNLVVFYNIHGLGCQQGTSAIQVLVLEVSDDGKWIAVLQHMDFVVFWISEIAKVFHRNTLQIL